MKQNNI